MLVLCRALLEYLEPARAHNHQYGRALREGLIDGLGKVLAWPDVFNVHEDTMDAHNGSEVIGNPAGVGSPIVAPITDEDVVRGGDLVVILLRAQGVELEHASLDQPPHLLAVPVFSQ